MSLKVMAWPAFKNRQQNPYNYLLYTKLQELGVQVEEFSHKKAWQTSPDILHLHWPEFQYESLKLSVARSTMLLLLLRKLRAFKTKIIWTAHNLAPHDLHHPRLNEWFWNQFLPLLDGSIFLSEASRELAYATHPKLQQAQSFLVPHGHYRDIYPAPTPKEKARESLKLPQDTFVLLFVGAVRRYKGVLSLLQSYRQTQSPRTLLLIAGSAREPEYERELRIAAEGDNRIRLDLRFLSDEEMGLHLSAADLVVLPYQKILNSGSALLALSYSRPVLVPAQGSMQELQAQVGESWTNTYHDELNPQRLEQAISWAQSNNETVAPLEEFAWDKLAQQTLQAYETLLRSHS